jgi:hypothetical protein
MSEIYRCPFPVSHLREKIFSLREHWIKRIPDLPSYTLGRATYLDALNPEYFNLAAESNEIMYSHFGEFLENQIEFFKELLRAPVEYKDGFSVPGFHIFESHPSLTKQVAKPHIDVPFDDLEKGAQLTMDEMFLYSAAVELPSAGAAMESWFNITVHDALKDGVEACMERTKHEPSVLLEHHVDNMMIHSGTFFHQIEKLREHVDGEHRITLQGHALKMGGIWYLYW